MKIIVTGVVLVLFLLALACGVYVFGELRGSFVPKSTPQALAAKLEPFAEVVLPEGDGPYPVVLAFHGCGGLVGRKGPKLIMDRYAKAAAEAGIATVIVDSLRPRKIGFEEALNEVCSGRKLRGAERAGDVLAMLDWARRDARFDNSRIAIAGWSHGGWAVMDLFAMDVSARRPHNLAIAPDDNMLREVAAVHITYPFCAFPALTRSRGWRATPQTRLVLAELDETANPQICEQAAEAMRQSGVPVEVVTIANATHGFDEEDQVDGSKARYEADKARNAMDAYAQWLASTLGAAPAQ